VTESLKTFLGKHLGENWIFYLIIPIVFGAGAFFGVLGVKGLNALQIKELENFLEAFITNLPQAVVDAPMETRHALEVNLKTLFYMWFLGLTVIGIPLTAIITFTRGYILGFTTGFLVAQNAARGVFVVLFTVLPQNVIMIPVIIIAAVSSISFSFFIIRGKFMGKALPLSKKFFSYTFAFVILGCFAALAALVQGYVSPSLIRAVFYFS